MDIQARALLACGGFVLAVGAAAHARATRAIGEDGEARERNPILFCTQVPAVDDFATIGSTFANHLGYARACPRGGDLWIRYPDGSLKNLTKSAGYGEEGLQGAGSIAVREPCVHWSGTKALFAMIIGSPGEQQGDDARWQIYEVDKLGRGETPVITRVPGQPADFNNVAPAYASDDAILFVSDRPRNGAAHLYPQLDEYEEAPTTSGLWRLKTWGGALELLNHSPSGVFGPSVDSYGRILFTRWDHLVRDQQADDDHICQCDYFGTFNWASEAHDAPTSGSTELFPEPRSQWIGHVDAQMPGYAGPLHDWKPWLTGHEVNHFFPWTMNQDGTDENTLNHLGRHELHGYFQAARDDDPNLESHLSPGPFTANSYTVGNLTRIREDPHAPGWYLAIQAPEFFTHGSGQIVRVWAPPTANADQVRIEPLTHPATANVDESPGPEHSGMYRDVLPLAGGSWIASHAPTTDSAGNVGNHWNPDPVYDFRLRRLVRDGEYWRAGPPLTNGLSASVQWYDPDELISYSGPLWELWPAEVVAKPRPRRTHADALAAPEREVLASVGVEAGQLRQWLRERNLALIVSRNVTRRDRNDRQQPFNLRVPGGTATVATPGTVYAVSHFQIFQGDQIRGLTMGGGEPVPGRRVLAQPMHEPAAINPPNPNGPPGSVAIAPDGSTAALVPAKRALSWQLTDGSGEGVVRERYWVTFQPGEVRTCTTCHGLSSADQLGQPEPENPPQALAELLQHLRQTGGL